MAALRAASVASAQPDVAGAIAKMTRPLIGEGVLSTFPWSPRTVAASALTPLMSGIELFEEAVAPLSGGDAAASFFLRLTREEIRRLTISGLWLVVYGLGIPISVLYGSGPFVMMAVLFFVVQFLSTADLLAELIAASVSRNLRRSVRRPTRHGQHHRRSPIE
jgi:hypothetical protein